MGKGRPPKCPYCGSTKPSQAKGFRYNKSGIVRLRRCKACKRRWTLGPVMTNGQVSSPAFVSPPSSNTQSTGQCENEIMRPDQLDSGNNLSNQSEPRQEDAPPKQ
jgi:hypothetical protein